MIDLPLPTKQHFEKRNDERKHHDRRGNPPDDQPPAATKRLAAAISAGQANGPYLYAAFGKHTAITAYRLAALGTWTSSFFTAVLATSNGAAAAAFDHQAARHWTSLAQKHDAA
jgi:hypothetical protein